MHKHCTDKTRFFSIYFMLSKKLKLTERLIKRNLGGKKKEAWEQRKEPRVRKAIIRYQLLNLPR